MEGNPMMSLILLLALVLLYMLPVALGLSKTFKKAGVEGWKAFIPVYNLLVMLKIIGEPWWWALAISSKILFAILWKLAGGTFSGDVYRVLSVLCSFLSVVFSFRTFRMLSFSFGQSTSFAFGLSFLPFIFFPILGYGRAEYEGPFGDPDLYEAYQQSKSSSFDFENDILAT